MERRARTRLELLRAERGLTQGELAKGAGVSRATITAIETGAQRQIRSLTYARLARFLDVPIGDLIEEGAA